MFPLLDNEVLEIRRNADLTGFIITVKDTKTEKEFTKELSDKSLYLSKFPRDSLMITFIDHVIDEFHGEE